MLEKMYFKEGEQGTLYTLSEVRELLRGTMIASDPSDETMLSLGYVRVWPGARPEADVVEPGEVVFNEEKNRWEQHYVGRAYTEAELTARFEAERATQLQNVKAAHERAIAQGYPWEQADQSVLYLDVSPQAVNDSLVRAQTVTGLQGEDVPEHYLQVRLTSGELHPVTTMQLMVAHQGLVDYRLRVELNADRLCKQLRGLTYEPDYTFPVIPEDLSALLVTGL